MELEGVDPQTGYCSETGIYYSKLAPPFLPRAPIDLVTYLFAPKYGDRVAVVEAKTGARLTFAELERCVRVVAAGLWQHLKISKADVVCILSPNSIEFEVLFLAIASLGGIVTTLNPMNTSAEIKKQVLGAGSKCVVTVPQLLAKTKGIDLPVILIGDDKIVTNQGYKPQLRYSDLLLGDPKTTPSVNLRQDDPILIMFSSGTTGPSKGVLLTHGNIIAMSAIMTSPQVDGGLSDVVLHLIPMFHVFGLMISVANVSRGSTVVILPRFDLVEMISAIQTYKISATPIVPPILLLMIKQDVVLKYDTTSLRNIGIGAAPLGKDLLDQCAQRFPNAKLIQGYGMTESCGVGTATPGNGATFADHFGSAGVLMPCLEAKVVDPSTNKALPPTEQGELWMRGPNVMKEYLRNPQATAETIDKDGWLHTGDLVYFDTDGYLYIVDRLKELIKYKANQVAPAELESLLLSHPGVDDCAVIPYPDEAAGEIPMAYIVKKPGSALTVEEVIRFVAEQVAPYKKIRKVAFIEVIPKSATGKTQRRELVLLARVQSKL